MKKSSDISKDYSKALKPDATTVVANTGNAQFADYSESDLSALPEDVLESSYGCGNPLAFSDVQAGDTVLDLGCGAGLDLLLAAEKVTEHGRVIGVDMNRDMLALAEKRCVSYSNIELVHGQIESLPVQSQSVDWVISNCVINLSNDKARAFEEIARVLKPGGKMLVSDIVAEQLPFWVRYSGVLQSACGGAVISENQYLQGLKMAGLKERKIIARQYYRPEQLAAIVFDALPHTLQRLRCCGRQIFLTGLTWFARPISKLLWSAKISARC